MKKKENRCFNCISNHTPQPEPFTSWCEEKDIYFQGDECKMSEECEKFTPKT